MFPTIIFSFLLAVATADRIVPNLNTPVQPITQFRILGGEEATPHEFPHMVTLDRDYENHFCGGGIIDKNWVITAAHCLSYVVGETFRIKAGKHSLKIVEDTEQVINVSKVFGHKKYPGGAVVASHDIALLKLEKPLVFNEFVKPIALPTKDIEVVGDVILSGWGLMENKEAPENLRRGKMTVIDFKTCKANDISASGPPSAVTNTMLCTGPKRNKVFACNLDSGSPLIKEDGNKTYLAGVFSWLSYPCGKKNGPSVFTKVSLYVDWIQDIISKN